MDHFLVAWSKTSAVERGYVNNPNDPGGETNHGITVAVARFYGYAGPMIDLTAEQAAEIARRGYWVPLSLDSIAFLSPPIAYELFDTNFNMWARAAGQFLQRALNALNRQGAIYPDLAIDGAIGPGTIDALSKFLTASGSRGETVLLRCLNALQCADYVRQCEANRAKEEFFFGWVLQRVLI